MRDCKPSQEEIQAKIEEYDVESKAYLFFKNSIVTLKIFFKKEGYKSHIEPKIIINSKEKRPDLLVFDSKGEAAAIDHKFFKRRKKCKDLSEEIDKLKEYLGITNYFMKGNEITLNIKDVVLLTPIKSWEKISHCYQEISESISFVVYTIESDNIKILNRSFITNTFVSKLLSKRKDIFIPDEVQRIYFLSQDPPLPLLLSVLYKITLSLSQLDPMEENYQLVKVGTLRNELSKILPSWITTGGQKAQQMTPSYVKKFVEYMTKLRLGKQMGGAIKITRPKNKDFKMKIYEALAKYEICHERTQKKSRKVTLLDFM